jgi:hypothetical protein
LAWATATSPVWQRVRSRHQSRPSRPSESSSEKVAARGASEVGQTPPHAERSLRSRPSMLPPHRRPRRPRGGVGRTSSHGRWLRRQGSFGGVGRRGRGSQSAVYEKNGGNGTAERSSRTGGTGGIDNAEFVGEGDDEVSGGGDERARTTIGRMGARGRQGKGMASPLCLPSFAP